MNCIVKGDPNRVFGVIFDPNRPDIKARLTDILSADLGVIIGDPSCATTQPPKPGAPAPGIFGICAVIDGSNHLYEILGAE